MRFWQTLAIINAIWATVGGVDWGSVVHLALVVWSLWELDRAEKADRAAAKSSDNVHRRNEATS